MFSNFTVCVMLLLNLFEFVTKFKFVGVSKLVLTPTNGSIQF